MYNLLLVSNEVYSFLGGNETFQTYLINKYVIPITYDYDNINSYTDLLKKIHDKYTELRKKATISSVALMYHNSNPNTLKCFYKDVSKSTINANIEEYELFTTFIKTLKILYSIKDFDLISCDIVSETTNNVFTKLDCDGVNVNASINMVGTEYDWVLEYGKIDLIGTYFNNKIKRTKLVLAVEKSLPGETFTDDFKNLFTYTKVGSSITITAIDNNNVVDKSILIIPSKINTLNVTNIIASIPTTVKKLTICSGLTNIGNSTGCEFTSVVITTGNNTTIGNYQALQVAKGCSLTINEGITAINNEAFKNCSKFSGPLIIPISVLTIGSSAFNGCSGFTKLNLNMATVGMYAFYGCSGLSGELVLPVGRTLTKNIAIPEYAFFGCSKLSRVTFNEHITSIANNAFEGCSGLTGELVFPMGRTQNSTFSIPAYAFSGCSGLSKVTFGENITSIGKNAFSGCSGLTGELVFPVGRTQNSTFSIPDYAFSGCSKLSKVTFGENITSIGKNAFAGCSGLTGELKFPTGRSFCNIPEYAFSGCSGLSKVTFGENIIYIEKNAFAGCSGLTGELNLPPKLLFIDHNTFSGCSKLSGNLRIKSNIESIGVNAFSGCIGLNGVLIFETTKIKIINNYAFSGCSNLNGSLSIPNSVTSIGNNAFSECSKMTGSLILPKNISSIGENAFSGCSGFSGELRIPSLVISVGSNCFDKCAFTKIHVPNTLTLPSSLPIVYYDITLIVTDLNANYKNSEKSSLVINTGLSIKPDTFAGCKFNRVTIMKGNTAGIVKQEFENLAAYLDTNCSLTIEEGITSIDIFGFYKCINFSGTLQVNNKDTIIINANAIKDCNFNKISTTAKIVYIMV